MRTILRAGAVVGGVACVALAALQLDVALLAVVGIPLAGVVAGLCAAKWLERWWYGRQLEAGARAGLYACGLAACGVLASLVLRGPRDLATLAARSQLGPVSLAPVVNDLAVFSWVGADILIVLAALVAGILVAALTSQLFAWSKSGRALRVVEQARLAAAALTGDADPTPAPVSTPPQGIPAAALLNRLPVAAFTGAPVPASASPLGLAAPRSTFGPLPSAEMPASPRRATAAPALAPVPAAPQPAQSRERLLQTPPPPQNTSAAPAQAAGELAAATSVRRARKSSTARRPEKQLSSAMKEALAAWADENLAVEPAVESAAKSRAPQPSTYLNSAAPAPKRNRKKNATRDWIC